MFIQGLMRFKSQKEIRIKVRGEWHTLSWREAVVLNGYLADMLGGDLIEVKAGCGCGVDNCGYFKIIRAPQPPPDCGHSKRYKGLRKPRCAGGSGCQKCWKIWYKTHG